MFDGRLLAIAIHPKKAMPMVAHDRVAAVAGSGLMGDHYAAGRDGSGGTKPEQEVTLIEREAIEAACREYQLSFDHLTTRRNLLTESVPLNHLVGREFAVGEVILRGIELCEPCGHLENLTFPGIKRSLIHRGGLRAQVLRSGTMQVGDRIGPVT